MRGEAGADSDYDAALFLWDLREGDLTNRWVSWIALLACAAKSSPDTVAFIQTVPAGAYRDRRPDRRTCWDQPNWSLCFFLRSNNFAPNNRPPTARRTGRPRPIKGAGTASMSSVKFWFAPLPQFHS